MIPISKRVICALLLAVLVAGLHLMEAGAAAEAVIGYLPDNQLYRVAIITPDGDEEYVYQVEYRVEAGRLFASTIGPGYTMESRYDADLRLLNSEMAVLTSEDAVRIGFDRRVAAYDPEEEQYVLVYYLEDKLQSTREIRLREQATEIEVLGLHLQALLNQGRTDFHGRLLDLNSPGKMQLDSRILTDKQIKDLANQKKMAPQVRSLLEKREEIIVFSIGYDGFLRFFFPTRFYVVLENTAPYRILSYWAGSGERLRFHIYQFLE